MEIIKKIKAVLLTVFREILVYHHSSLEFRAKLIAAMISSSNDINECEEKYLQEVAKKIYGKDEARVDVLINTVKEYAYKVIENNGLSIDELIFEIDKDIKNVPRFASKINIDRLKKFMDCTDDKQVKITQERILEYLQNEVQNYKNSVKKR